MKAIYKQKGESLDYTNNGTATIEAGELVVIEKHVGVAGCTIKAGETGSIHVVGVFEVPCKALTSPLKVGQDVYFKPTDGVTTTSTDTPLGYVVKAAENGATSVLVRIG